MLILVLLSPHGSCEQLVSTLVSGIILNDSRRIFCSRNPAWLFFTNMDTLTDTTAPKSFLEDMLFGADPTPHIVSVELGSDGNILVYRRTERGVVCDRQPFRPWLLLLDPPKSPLTGATLVPLQGETGYRYLIEFTSMPLFHEGRRKIRDQHAVSFGYSSATRMALLRSGQTLFKGMNFENTVRMQFDIETAGLDPNEEDNRILLIVVADNRGLLEILEGDEVEILQEFLAMIRERDPDVIEGHNMFGFDIPFVIERAHRYGISFGIGRDGSEPRRGQGRNFNIGTNVRPYTPFYAHGRHLLDTYLLVQRFDWAKGALSSYGLKECARHFGFAAQERIELPREKMAQLYRDDAPLVREYARQDVIETGKLAELIAPVEFYQTQMVADNYGQVALIGTGEKINTLFLRAYLAAGVAIPRQQPSHPYEGAYTNVRMVGVVERVVKADVESLYPSLMLTHKIAPSSDTLGVFLPILKYLTERRFEAKRKAATEPDAQYWDGLQNSFKILINSFYGYLGGPFCFNDYYGAEKVTKLGRELIHHVSDYLEHGGSKIIEIDTDGVYFVPPNSISDESAERDYVKQAAQTLPEGIRLAYDGRYRRMLSLRMKNYVLQTYEGKLIFKGALVRSRADEPYGKKFLSEAIRLLLENDIAGVGTLYADLVQALVQHKVAPEALARRERVTEKTFFSEVKRRSASVAKGIPVGEHVYVYEKSDGTLGLVENYQNDENTKYYLGKLYKFAKRLEAGFPGDFNRWIPKPTAHGLPEAIQPTLDLF